MNLQASDKLQKRINSTVITINVVLSLIKDN